MSFLKVGLGKRLTHPYAYEGSLKLRVLESLTWAPQACGHFQLHTKILYTVLIICMVQML